MEMLWLRGEEEVDQFSSPPNGSPGASTVPIRKSQRGKWQPHWVSNRLHGNPASRRLSGLRAIRAVPASSRQRRHEPGTPASAPATAAHGFAQRSSDGVRRRGPDADDGCWRQAEHDGWCQWSRHGCEGKAPGCRRSRNGATVFTASATGFSKGNGAKAATAARH